MLNAVRTPKEFLLSVWPLPLSLATTHRISVDFSSSPYLDVSVQAVPLIYLFIQYMMHELHSCGLLHSEISGSMLAYNSPLLIAVNHVLLRLSMPRHSLCALLCFTICSFGSSQNFRVQLFVVFFTQHFGYSPSCRCFYLLVVFTCICFHYSVFKLHFSLSFSKNRYQQMISFIY